MKLSHSQIKEISVGTAYVTSENDRTVLHRFTKAQEKFYKTVCDDFYNKCFATAGISLDFYTDSKYLELKVFVKQCSSRRFLSHTVFVDGKPVGSLDARFEDTGVLNSAYLEKIFTLGCNSESRRITVFLPWSFSSEICELNLEDGATLAPVTKKIKMICFGDSITHGYDAKEPQNTYATTVAAEFYADARNKGIGGERFRPDLAAQKDEDFEPDIITVAYGTNDWSIEPSRELFERNCEGFYSELARNYPNAKIFAIAPIWRKDHERITNVGEFAYAGDFIKRVAAKHHNIIFVDGYSFVPQNPELFGDKFLHPNDEGFAYYAENLIKEMKTYL